jgi:hypothetical protein
MMMRAPLACLSAGVLLSGWGGNVWVAGNGNQDRQILQFSPEGRWAPSAAPAHGGRVQVHPITSPSTRRATSTAPRSASAGASRSSSA